MATWSDSPAADFVDAPNFATLATLFGSGAPHTSVIWVARDGEDVIFSTVVGRQKHRNMLEDPRVSLLVLDRKNPYRYLEVRGEVSMTEEGGRELIDALAMKYRGEQRYLHDDGTDNVRVVCRLSPTKIVMHG